MTHQISLKISRYHDVVISYFPKPLPQLMFFSKKYQHTISAHNIERTESRGRVAITPTSYSKRPWFQSRPGDRLS
jgi:hypothetical protein